MVEYISIFILSCFVLAKSGQQVVKSLVNIAKILKWREFVVATIIMAFASTLPELFVGVTASIEKKPQLAVGNILGSNIIALTLLVGLATLLGKKLEFKEKTIQKASFFATFFALLPLILIIDKSLSRSDGLILIGAFLFYLGFIFKEQKKFSKIYEENNINPLERLKLFLKAFGLFLLSLILLLLSARGIVFSSNQIASLSGFSLMIIGILAVALGTSLPEIVFCFHSVRSGHKEMMLGDALGAIITNSGLILGLSLLISPFCIDNFLLYFNGILFSFLSAFLFLIFSLTKAEISRKEGIILLFVYFIFVLMEFLIEILR